MSKNKGFLLVVMAAVCWGLTGSLLNLAPSQASPIDFGVIRLLIGGGFLLGYGLVKERSRLKVKHKANLLKAAIAIGLYQPFFFLGVDKIGIATGTVIAIGSAPVIAGLVAIIRKRPVSKSWLMGTLASVAGLLMLFTAGADIEVSLSGYVFSLLAGLMYVLYVEFSKPVYIAMDKLLANGLIFSIAGLMLSPLLIQSDLSWVISFKGFTSLAMVGLLATSLPYLLYSYGIAVIENHVGVLLTLFEPLTASVLGIIVFRETLSTQGLLGMALMGGGLLLSCLPSRLKAVIEEAKIN